MDDPGMLFDQAVESARRKASTTTSASPSRLPILGQPRIVHFPALQRNLAQIDPNLRQVIRRLILGELPWPLFLHGPTGLGKTRASLCLLDYCPGYTLYTTASKWSNLQGDARFGRASERYSGGSKIVTLTDLQYRMETASCAVLDELESRCRVSDAHYESVKDFLDVREGKPLVVVSNSDIRTVSSIYDDRIADRLAAGTILGLRGESRRLAHGQRRCTVEPGRDES